MRHRQLTTLSLNSLIRQKILLSFLLGALCWFGDGSAAIAQGNIIYVNAAAPAGGNGQSWASAYKDLQDALVIGNYQAGDTVWVAAGTYYPSPVINRDSSFQLRNNLVLLGGFLPGHTQVSQRDWQSNTTTLSGDLGILNNNIDNAYNVVSGWFADSSAVIDGFTISDGNANGGGFVNGGGMWNFTSPGFTGAIVRNCTFRDNSAASNGGAIYNWENSPTIINCHF